MIYKKGDILIIPNESIRIRIVANSNNINDLMEKKSLKNKIEEEVYNLVKDAKDINEARDELIKNMDYLDNLVGKNTKQIYTINYGMNYFPKKKYKGVVYEAGMYESLVITLGDGIGDNWWCVLFPALCLIEENTDTTDVEYKLLIEEVLKN